MEIGILKVRNINVVSTEASSLDNMLAIPAKPFLKWAGGKKQLLSEIRRHYPFDENVNKYAEPFVGGGAVLFDILNTHDLKEIYINDINEDLINAYRCVKDYPEELISLLKIMQEEFIHRSNESRKEYYLEQRKLFNTTKVSHDDSSNLTKAALMIFLNKTCFNGLYRVNKNGEFNVPMGSSYSNPLICDESNLRNASQKLQKVRISCGDYKSSYDFIDSKTFAYFDPPYRPLTNSSSFTSYTKYGFGDNEQKELAEFIKRLVDKGAKVAVSNSDPKNVDLKDNFFDSMYSYLNIVRVTANRMINSNANSRGKIYELLVTNC
jgi:DNA adenine methylase